MFDHSADAENLIRCFDPSVSFVEGAEEHLVISPRWGRIRRSHPLLASSPAHHGPGLAWQAARKNLLTCSDHSIQLALSTYEYRIRMTMRFHMESLLDPSFDLHEHCHAALDRSGHARGAVTLRREDFWIRSLTPDAEGHLQFECGNTFLISIPENAVGAEARTLL